MAVLLLCIAIVASYLCNHVSAQVSCANPLIIGELRNLQSHQCVDIPGYDGAGSLQTYECDGYADQQLILCGDGTIRNEARNYCFTPQGTGDVDVSSSACQHYPEIPDSQKWQLGRTLKYYDLGGMIQEAREIINVASGKCLDVRGYDGHGNIGVYKCEDRHDQYFYFRSRGKQVARGRLRNEKSNQCLDVDGSDGKGNVKMSSCQDTADQWFRFYENGELVNEKSRQCVAVASYSGTGNIQIYPCGGGFHQMWTRPSSLCNGDSCSFANKMSKKCLDVLGYDGKGEVSTYDFSRSC